MRAACRNLTGVIAVGLTTVAAGELGHVETATDHDVDTLNRHHIRILAPRQLLVPIKQRVRTCCETLTAWLGAAGQGLATIEIAAAGLDLSPPADNLLQMKLPETATRAELTYMTLRLLLRRRALALRHPGDPAAMPTDWIAAALTVQVLHGERESVTRTPPDCRAAAALFETNTFPLLDTLFETPVAPEMGAASRLYGIHCYVLARLIQGSERAAPSPLQRVIELQARGRPAPEAVAFVVHGRLQPGETLQTWYERQARGFSRSSLHPCRADQVTRKLQDIETVPAIMPGARGGDVVRIPLEEVPDLMDSHGMDAAGLQHMQAEIFALAKRAPTTLRPPLRHHIEALKKLETGATFGFRWALKRARRQYAEALERQQNIDAYLDHLEQRHLSLDDRFGAFFEVHRNNRRRLTRLDPDLHRYLDSLLR